jgi:hypothetical protein
MIYDILREFLNKFVIFYLDDVCAYNRTLEEHLEHLRLVLHRFKEGLKFRLKRCSFGLHEMEYLGYTVSGGKIFVLTKKLEYVKDWLVPTTKKEVRIFVQFCNFYAKFIHHLSGLSAPWTDLLRKTHPHEVTLNPACLLGSHRDSQLPIHFRVMPDPSGNHLGRALYRDYIYFANGKCANPLARPRRKRSTSLLLLCA